MRMTRPGFWRDLWALVHPYWKSEERLLAWVLLVAIVALTLGMVYMNVQFNTWYNDFYNALQDKNVKAFWKQMERFGGARRGLYRDGRIRAST